MESTPGAMFSSADAYDRYVGRYGVALSEAHVRAAGVQPGHTARDVGCGTGAPTRRLAETIGADHVAAVDPWAPFVETCRARVPGADVRIAAAESLPDFGRRLGEPAGPFSLPARAWFVRGRA